MNLLSRIVLSTLLFFAATTVWSEDDSKVAVRQELFDSYAAVVKAYAETAIYPKTLADAGYAQKDKSVKLDYKVSKTGFLITSSKGDFSMSLDEKKNLTISK